LREEIVHFADCIANHYGSTHFHNLSDGILGARVVVLLEAARESLSRGRTIGVRVPHAEEILAV